MRKFLKITGVIVGALILTTLGISASDTLQGVSGSLVSMALKSQKVAGCGEEAALVVSQGRKICVDIFEASPGEACPVLHPKNLQETEKDLNTSGCAPVSKNGGDPWRFVSLSQAQRACAAGGKRLLTNEEWYRAALGTPTDENTCNVKDTTSQAPQKSKESACRSGSGVYDMVGNAWEWVDASVENGKYKDRELPDTGYVAGVDGDGVAVTTHTAEDELYGKDYFWRSADGVRGMLRGGFYGSGNDGGIYALNASVDPGFGSAGVSFRCVREYIE